MGQVERCLEEDIPAVAHLHGRVFFHSADPPSDQLQSYYQEVFFRNPWHEDDIPSLVYRFKGRVTGFLGCIPRKMEVRGDRIRVAVPHRLMVAPDVDSPLAGMRLLQHLLAGPQDLTVADGANDTGRKILEWSGASMSRLYSLNWFRPLRPFVFGVEMAGKRRRGKTSLLAVARPVARVLDRVLSGRVSPFGVIRPVTRDVEISADLVLKGIERFSRSYIIRPVYDLSAVEWLLNVLRANSDRGELEGIGILNPGDELIGVCLYYMNAARVAEVMLMAAREDSRDAVLRHIIYCTRQRGGVGLVGRLEPRFLPNFADHQCLMKCGDWAFLHARNQELVDIINGGDAFLSALDGELWLRSPMDRL